VNKITLVQALVPNRPNYPLHLRRIATTSVGPTERPGFSWRPSLPSRCFFVVVKVALNIGTVRPNFGEV